MGVNQESADQLKLIQKVITLFPDLPPDTIVHRYVRFLAQEYREKHLSEDEVLNHFRAWQELSG